MVLMKKSFDVDMCKKIFFLFWGVFVVSFCIFIPAVRNFAILCFEKIINNSLSRDIWNLRFIKWELTFLIVLSVMMLPFVRISNSTVIFYLSAILVGFVLLFCYVQYFGYYNLIDSDDAADMMNWKACAAEKSFFPFGWNYTTDLTFIGNRFIGGPLFLFFSDNWAFIRMVVTVVSLGFLFVTTLFLLRTLDVRPFWIRYICSIIAILPFSDEVWRFMTVQTFYVPHIIIGFLYISIFIRIQTSECNISKIDKILFLVLSFICGITSVRYALFLVIPIVILSIIPYVKLYFRQNGKLSICDVLNKNDLFLVYAFLSFFLFCIGFVCNVKIVTKILKISDFSHKCFQSLGDYTIHNVFADLACLLGYRNCVGFFSLKGMLNILLYPCCFVFRYSFYCGLKKIQNKKHKIMLTFCMISFIINTFFIINVMYAVRYFIPSLFFCIPCFAILVSNKEILKSVRQLLCIVWIPFLFLSSAAKIHDVLPLTNSINYREGLVNFLSENNYTFGYASYWNANILTGMTNGHIEVGTIKDLSGGDIFPSKYQYWSWGNPKYYYSDDYHGADKIFFLLTEAEYNVNNNLKILNFGKEVYRDDYFRVYEYKNHEFFKNVYQ